MDNIIRKSHLLFIISTLNIFTINCLNYKGCFTDYRLHHDLNGFQKRFMSMNDCLNECSKRQFQFAGVYNGESCHCGNRYGNYGHSIRCYKRCDNERCGGIDSTSVYGTHSFYRQSIQSKFQGVWVATVTNIDWPSKAGLKLNQMKSEINQILDTLQYVHANTIIFQVRPHGDAMYQSELEPWSEYLMGKQGMAPPEHFDPLQFLIDGASKRHMEVHAWINPYRAAVNKKKYRAMNHMSKRFPNATYIYGNYLWMDPSSETVMNHTINVVKDLVKRYHIDGIHMDDYFYPYPITDVPFPDSAAYHSYLDKTHSHPMSLDDWRRDNVNRLIQTLQRTIREMNSHVQFGISPFGIWRPNNPSGIKGLDQYRELYADAKKWLNEGWIDYLSPQLYWKIDPPAQSFPKLLNWWIGENVKNKKLYPGIATYRMRQNHWPLSEIGNQLKICNDTIGCDGTALFSMRDIEGDVNRIKNLLRNDVWKNKN
ncbi:hypothetical protein SNEBB_002409 [Seison nebaliae]|nr:hypothetical protein SNEBB_002409 [Seison nebaliae]